MTEAPNPPNLNGLVELANRDGVDIRPTLLRVMTDLYVQKQTHTEQEEQHFTELALRLIDLVDAKTRVVVANKIAGYPTAPAAVRHRLLKELISAQGSRAGRCRGRSARRQRSGAGRRTERTVLCLQRRRAAADPAQSALRTAVAGRADCAGHRARVDPSPGGRGARAQQRAVRPRTRAHLRHFARAGAPAVSKTNWASQSWWRPWRSACRRRCCSGSCCASIRRSANRCSGSTIWPCCTKRSSPMPRSG